MPRFWVVFLFLIFSLYNGAPQQANAWKRPFETGSTLPILLLDFVEGIAHIYLFPCFYFTRTRGNIDVTLVLV